MKRADYDYTCGAFSDETQAFSALNFTTMNAADISVAIERYKPLANATVAPCDEEAKKALNEQKASLDVTKKSLTAINTVAKAAKKAIAREIEKIKEKVQKVKEAIEVALQTTTTTTTTTTEVYTTTPVEIETSTTSTVNPTEIYKTTPVEITDVYKTTPVEIETSTTSTVNPTEIYKTTPVEITEVNKTTPKEITEVENEREETVVEETSKKPTIPVLMSSETSATETGTFFKNIFSAIFN